MIKSFFYFIRLIFLQKHLIVSMAKREAASLETALYLFYYLVYSDPFKPGALTGFATGLFNEKAASNFVRYM